MCRRVNLSIESLTEHKKSGIIRLESIRSKTTVIAAIKNRHRVYNETLSYISQMERAGKLLVIRQGKYRLEVELLEKQPQPLRAPISGTMIRTIHESLCSKVHCRFWNGKNLLFEQIDFCGSFEFANQ